MIPTKRDLCGPSEAEKRHLQQMQDDPHWQEAARKLKGEYLADLKLKDRLTWTEIQFIVSVTE